MPRARRRRSLLVAILVTSVAVPTTAVEATATALKTSKAQLALNKMAKRAKFLADPGKNANEIAATLQLTVTTIRSPAQPRATLAAAGRLQQLAYRRLADHSDWNDAVLAALTEPAVTAVRRDLEAEAALRTIGSPTPTDQMPPWRIVAPASAKNLLAWYQQAATDNGLDWRYLAAINLVETRIGRISGTSSAGAKGPMQFLRSTWNECCTGNILDPHDAIFGAAKYLRMRGAPVNMDKALHGYNPSDGYVAAIKDYAANLADDAKAFGGYYYWQVFVTTKSGAIRLPIGYPGTKGVTGSTYLARNPGDRAP